MNGRGEDSVKVTRKLEGNEPHLWTVMKLCRRSQLEPRSNLVLTNGRSGDIVSEGLPLLVERRE